MQQAQGDVADDTQLPYNATHAVSEQSDPGFGKETLEMMVKSLILGGKALLGTLAGSTASVGLVGVKNAAKASFIRSEEEYEISDALPVVTRAQLHDVLSRRVEEGIGSSAASVDQGAPSEQAVESPRSTRSGGSYVSRFGDGRSVAGEFSGGQQVSHVNRFCVEPTQLGHSIL